MFYRGYASRLEEFIYHCLERLKKFEAEQHEDTFDMKKETWLRDLKNFFYDEPNEQVITNLSKIILPGNHTTKHKIAVCENFKFDRFCELSKDILKNGRHLWY